MTFGCIHNCDMRILHIRLRFAADSTYVNLEFLQILLGFAQVKSVSVSVTFFDIFTYLLFGEFVKQYT